MKARIVGGEFDGVGFEISLETKEKIKDSTKYSDVKEYCRKNKVYDNRTANQLLPDEYTTANFIIAKGSGYNHVRVPLPQANTNWSFAAFDWVKAFCKYFEGTYNCWPHHDSNLDCVNYLWIKI